MEKPRVFLGASAKQAKLLQALTRAAPKTSLAWNRGREPVRRG